MVLERAYDELLRIKGFGVNGGMTPANLKIAYDLALQIDQIDRPIPLDEWTDFRFQKRALETPVTFPGEPGFHRRAFRLRSNSDFLRGKI
jgi:hypothetical protein